MEPTRPRRRPPRPPAPPGSAWAAAGPYLGLGAQILAAMVVFAGGGLWLDARLGSSPWALLAGVVLSFVAVGAILYRVTRAANAESRARQRDDPGGPSRAA